MMCIFVSKGEGAVGLEVFVRIYSSNFLSSLSYLKESNKLLVWPIVGFYSITLIKLIK